MGHLRGGGRLSTRFVSHYSSRVFDIEGRTLRGMNSILTSVVPSSYTNVTNQPTFGCANSTCLLTCDDQIRFYHTNVTTGKYAPQGVSASISIAPSPKSGLSFFPHGAEFVGAKGVKVTQAFLELNYLDCKDLKGSTYLGV